MGMTGTEIRKIRESRGETQAEFGAHFGVDQSTAHRWETYGVSERRIAIIRLLAELKTSRRHATRAGR